jgi:copper chaperone CopZ
MATPFQIRVSGMHCGSCVRRLQKALDAVTGVKSLAVDVGLVEFEVVEEGARKKVEDAIALAGFAVDG